MRKKFRRQWIGYSIQEVERTIALMDHDYQLKLAKLQADHAVMVSRRAELQEKLQRLQENLASLRALEDGMAAALLNQHLRSAQVILAAKTAAEEEDRAAQQRVLAKKDELVQLEQQYQHLRQEIRVLADRYGAAAAGAKGLGDHAQKTDVAGV